MDLALTMKATKQEERKTPDKVKNIFLEKGQVIVGVFGKYYQNRFCRDQVSWFSLIVTRPGVAEKFAEAYMKEHPDEFDEDGKQKEEVKQETKTA